MFCTKCGTKLIDNALFCTSCGAPVKNSSAPVQEQVVTQSQAKAETEKPKKKRGLVKGLTVLLVILVVVAIGLFFVTNKDVLAQIEIPFFNQADVSSLESEEVTNVKTEQSNDKTDGTDNVSENKRENKSDVIADESSIEAILQSKDLARYHDEVLIDKYGEIDRDKTYYSYYENDNDQNVWAGAPSELAGIFASYIMDYDGDGEDELLVILAEGSSDETEPVKFSYNMYEAGDENPRDSIAMVNPTDDEFMVDFNLLPIAGKVYITEYSYRSLYLSADGVAYVTGVHHYDGERFVEDFLHQYAGSDFSETDAEVARDARKLGSLGFTNTAQNMNYQYRISHENGMVSLGCLLGIWEHKYYNEMSDTFEKLYSATDKAKIAGKVIYNIYPSYDSYEKDQYILPMSSERLLTDVDLEGLTKDQLRIARNELYARHGRMFDSEDLQKYFNSKSWYTGYVPANEFTDDWLTDIEKKNKDVIVNFEKKRGYR